MIANRVYNLEMQTEPTIKCTNCGMTIALTQTLAGPLLAAERAKLAQERQALERSREQEIARAKKQIEQDAIANAKLAVEEEVRKKDLAFQEMAQRERLMKERLDQAAKEQAQVAKKLREIEDKERDLQLSIERGITEQLPAIREKAVKDANEQASILLQQERLEKESLKKKIEELQLKAQSGSQQVQGEALELQLEELLRSKFIDDTIEPIPKGEHGGDCLQRVRSQSGLGCGTILWEFKRAKAWSDNWLTKLREDQRAAGAEVAAIVSIAMPKGVDTFEQIDGVHVLSTRVIVPVAAMLRESLIQLARAKIASQGQATKAGQVYDYITSTRYKQRVSAIVEAFVAMQDDLAAEQRAIQRQWAKRQTQIERIITATAGLHGDIQGIAGQSVPEIDGLSITKLLE